MKRSKIGMTPDFALVSYLAHEHRKTAVLHVGAVARLTDTSTTYWNKLRKKGKGPRSFEALDTHWYYLADVQDWLGFVITVEKSEGAHG